MQDSTSSLDALDRSILHALQMAPRTSWSDVGAVLGVDPATIGRRWERLHNSGQAWTTCYPGARPLARACVAFVEVEVRAGTSGTVADVLATYPQVVTVEHMAGGCDLLLTVMCSDLDALFELVSQRIAPLSDVVRTRTHVATRVYSEGGHWRLRVLTAAQQQQLAPPKPGNVQTPTELDDYDHRLITELSRDAREPAVRLAQKVGLSAPNVRTRLAAMVHHGDLSLRCEIARSLTSWPVVANAWANVPADRLDQVVQGLRSLAELRLCAAVTGPQNMLFAMQLSSVADVSALETMLAERLPHLHVADRSVAMRHVKLMGRLLDKQGRATGCVPIDPWLSPDTLPTPTSDQPT